MPGFGFRFVRICTNAVRVIDALQQFNPPAAQLAAQHAGGHTRVVHYQQVATRE